MLERLEINPHSVFAESELRGWDEHDFERLRGERLIRRTGTDASLWHQGGRQLSVIEGEDGALEAIDEYDTEFDPIPVATSDTGAWKVDLDVLTQRFRQENSLEGDRGLLHERLILIGEGTTGNAVLLALLADEPSGLPLCRRCRPWPRRTMPVSRWLAHR